MGNIVNSLHKSAINGSIYVSCKKCHYKFKYTTEKICSHCKHIPESQEFELYEQSLKASSKCNSNDSYYEQLNYYKWKPYMC